MSKRILFFLLSFFGIGVTAIAAQTMPVIKAFTMEEGCYLNKLSDNGLWGAAYGADANNTTLENYPYLLDIANHKTISLLSDEQKASSPNCGAHDVTDDGKIAVGVYNGKPAYCTIQADGSYTWTLLPLPAELATAGGYVSAVTPDGQYMAGTLYNYGDIGSGAYEEYPILWKNGEICSLDGMPQAFDETGSIQLNRLTDISADGKTILGCLAYIYPSYTRSYIYHVEDQTYTILGEGIAGLERGHIATATLCPNGEWVSGTAYLVLDTEGSTYADEQQVPYTYHLTDNTFTLYDEQQDYGIGGFAVCDNGLTTMATPINNPMRATMFRLNGFYYDLDLILSERYGMDFISTSGFGSTGTPVSLSADGRTLGALVIQEGNYVMVFPESIEEAAKSVNLLAKASVSPTSGSTFTTLRTLTVTFTKAPTVVDGNAAAIYQDGASEPLRQSLSIQPTENTSDCKSFNINFRPTKMEDGVRYKVVIPEGTFRLGSTDTYNREMTITYIGRKDAPVELTAASPEDGSELTSISYSSPVNLTFDTDVLLTEDSKAALYQEGVSTPIESLTLAASANNVAVYAVNKRNLLNNVNYQIKIPAAAITDIMGEHGNEEITLNYAGTYIPEVPADTLLFADDFNDPATSYNNFMRYEGDHLNPGTTSKSWNFDADNTPWYFELRQDENSADYCAGTSSMYSPAGTANDWMVIHQLYLPNKDCHLAFDVQSYLSTKKDSLQVYVWTNDAIYTTLDETIIGRILSEGTCIYNELENPGASEDNLEGDWAHRVISLEQFAGQYVYIAFANRNNDQSAIFVDNIEVIYKANSLVALNTEQTLVAEKETTISGVVKVNDETKTFTSITITYTNADGSVRDTISQDGLSLKKGDAYEFSFNRKMPLETGKENKLSISVTLDNETKTTEFVIKNLTFAPVKKVVVEEGTGTWCNNCPDGLIALEHLEESFPGQVIPIGIHYNDIYDFADYVGALGINAFPTARVNRRSEIVSPLSLNMNTLSYDFISEAGNETFMDLVISELAEEAEAEVCISSATFDMELNRLKLNATVRYALDKSAVSANVLFVLLEDKLKGIQHNGRANNTNPIYGDWGKNGIYGGMAAVEYVYSDVARSILANSINGTSGYIPTSTTSNESIPVEAEFSLPTNVADYTNAKVVCMLIDANSERVINADVCSLTDANPSAIAADEASSGFSLIRQGETIRLVRSTGTQASVSLFTAGGILLDQTEMTNTAILKTNGYRGIAIIKVTDECGQNISKISLR